jgi:protein SCO1/2
MCLGAMLLVSCGKNNKGDVAQSGPVIAMGDAQIGGPFTLTDHTGTVFTQDNFIGKPTLLYFGFSFCPDVCPSALQNMGAVQERVDPDGARLNYVFVGVDVERDTSESLAPYVTSRGFAKNLIGLSGTQAQMDVATTAYKVYAQKVDDPESAALYTFDHSDLMILLDKDGQFKDIFTRKDSLPEMETRVKFLLDSGK